jgi:type IV pilus assembly protein PilY1
VTDARIFTPDVDHPNGWGTILIGGFRLGGSCDRCTSVTGAPPMTVTADFGNGTETRTFYSAYFILDITNPETNPTLLWSFTSADLGLTTSYPAVVRVNPTADPTTSNTNAKWLVLVGSGPTGYDGSSTQTSKVFALEMPKPWTAGGGLVTTTFPTTDLKAFMGDLVTLDQELDFRGDELYFGDVVTGSGTPAWTGKVYRLSTGGGIPTTAAWGLASGTDRVPTVVISSFSCSPSPCPGPTPVGPVLGAPTLTADDSSKIWLFFGTGRFFSPADKTNADTQYFFGVKDPVASSACTETSTTNCERNDLVDVSSASICVVCTGGTTQVSGVTGVSNLLGTSTTTLQGLVQSKDGWVTTLPASRERVVVSPTVIGGIVFFPSFVPSNDLCTASGNSYLYALFYLTGSAWGQSVIGTEASGSNTVVRRAMDLGAGLTSQMAVHIGGQATDSSSGVTGRISVCSQSSTGALTCTRSNPPLTGWSRYISWNDQKT